MNKYIEKGINWTKRHSPQILTTLGVGCFTVGAVLIVPETIKALDLIEEEKQNRLEDWPSKTITDEQEKELLTFKPIDYVKTCWKVYSPSALLMFLGGVCVINANRINVKRTTALAGAYTMSEIALREFKNKAVEVVGEKKVEEIKEEVAKEAIAKNPPKSEQVFITNKGDILCCDSLSMRYFKFDVDDLKKVENQINLKLRNDGDVSLNTLYDYLGLEHTELGDELGWNINDDPQYLEIGMMPELTPDNQPCVYITFNKFPKYDYWRTAK